MKKFLNKIGWSRWKVKKTLDSYYTVYRYRIVSGETELGQSFQSEEDAHEYMDNRNSKDDLSGTEFAVMMVMLVVITVLITLLFLNAAFA